MKIIERIHNIETGETVDIERELTKSELADHKESEAKIKAMIDEQTAKAQSKAALLERLGITAEEAALLLG